MRHNEVQPPSIQRCSIMLSAMLTSRQGLQAAQTIARSLAFLVPQNVLAHAPESSNSLQNPLASTSGLIVQKISSRTQYRGFSAEAFKQQESASSNESNTSSESAGRELRSRLLDAALKFVPTHGWSQAALNAAANELGLSPAVTGVLQRREGELVEHFISRCNHDLASQLAARKASGELAQLRTRGMIALAVKLRLQMLAPVLDTWPQALAVATQPRNAPHALALLGQLVDEIWAAAGDTSTDMSWYTKRAMLAGVYTSTELYMLTDFSPEFAETWQALERRLDDAATLGKLARDMKSKAANCAQAAAGATGKMAAAAAAAASQANGSAGAAGGSGQSASAGSASAGVGHESTVDAAAAAKQA